MFTAAVWGIIRMYVVGVEAARVAAGHHAAEVADDLGVLPVDEP